MGEMISTRVAYGKALVKYGRENERVVVFDADLACATQSCEFQAVCPERFFNMGISECNMAGYAAGVATCGKIPVINSFAMFSTGRIYDQVRNSIGYPHLNVKIVGTHSGLSAGEDGATHQCIEDIALMRVIPGMTVLSPCDANETDAALKAMIDYEGPVYMRLGRSVVENVTNSVSGYKFELGKGVVLRDGSDITIVATGVMVQESLKAAEMLASEGIFARVIDMHTIKPLDTGILYKAATETKLIVTSEDHNVIGGLGGAVSEFVSENCPVPVIRHGVNDMFGRSGPLPEIMEVYGMTAEVIADKARSAWSKYV